MPSLRCVLARRRAVQWCSVPSQSTRSSQQGSDQDPQGQGINCDRRSRLHNFRLLEARSQTAQKPEPDLGLGFQVVGDALLDGQADADRVRLIKVDPEGTLAVIAVEDLIADRMGQYASGTAPEMLEQARTLFSLYKDADLIYMERRIREETSGTYGLADLQAGS